MSEINEDKLDKQMSQKKQENQLKKNDINLNHQNTQKKAQQIPEINKAKEVSENKPQNDQNVEQNTAKKQQPSLTLAQIQLKKQLQSMQFEPILIEEAILKTNNLQQAIQFIISKLEGFEQNQIIQSASNQVKIYFIVRMDLKMGTGKIAAQVGHAALKAFQMMRHSSSINDKNATLLIQWMQNGKKSKILQAQTQYEIRNYLDLASNKMINCCYIRDAGRTQIAAGSLTVAAIGPVRQCQVGFLKNLKQL